MALVVENEGQTTLDGTMQVLSTPTAPKTRVFGVELVNLSQAQYLEVHVMTKARPGGTLRHCLRRVFRGGISDAVYTTPVPLYNGGEFHVMGPSGVVIEWAILTMGDVALEEEGSTSFGTSATLLGTAFTSNKTRVLAVDLNSLVQVDEMVQVEGRLKVRSGLTTRRSLPDAFRGGRSEMIVFSTPLPARWGGDFQGQTVVGSAQSHNWARYTVD